MHVFYTPDIQSHAELPEEEAAHAIRVLRLQTGDEVTFIVRQSAPPPINVALSTYWKPSLRRLYGAGICTSQWLPLKIWTAQNGS